jgi:transcription antitermination factor NusG
MPLLPAETALYPGDLLENPAAHAAEHGAWMAFYTRSRREKELMRKILPQRIPFYCPVIMRRLKSPGGQVRSSFVPLFSNYVFTLVDDDQRRACLATRTISRCLPVFDQDELVTDLRRIQQLIATAVPLSPEAMLEPGQKVEVRSGPMKGIEGTIISRRGQQRLVVAVRFLNQGASLELDDIDLMAI